MSWGAVEFGAAWGSFGAQVCHSGVLTCAVLVTQLEAEQRPTEHTRGAGTGTEA